MNVVHVISGLGVGGAERMLEKMLRPIAALGVMSRVVSLRGGPIEGAIRESGGTVFNVDVGRRGWTGRVARAAHDVRRFDADIIHGWMYHGNLFASGLGVLCRRPTIWGVRQSLYSLSNEKPGTRLAIRMGSALSRQPSAILYNSTISRSQHEAIGYFCKRASVIPNGFDTDAFSPNAHTRSLVRKSLCIDDGSPLIGNVARFHPMKGHAMFLRAASAIRAAVPESKFLLVGRGLSESGNGLPQLASKLGIADALRFVPETDNVSAIMQALDVFCLSSAWGEGFPNVLGEAMACGIPCVSTDVGDARLVVGGTGRVVAVGDFAAMAQAAIGLLRAPAGERQERSRLARSRIQESYSIERVAAQVVDLYKMSLSGSTVRRRLR